MPQPGLRKTQYISKLHNFEETEFSDDVCLPGEMMTMVDHGHHGF